jgi:hypothetical protein
MKEGTGQRSFVEAVADEEEEDFVQATEIRDGELVAEGKVVKFEERRDGGRSFEEKTVLDCI